LNVFLSNKGIGFYANKMLAFFSLLPTMLLSQKTLAEKMAVEFCEPIPLKQLKALSSPLKVQRLLNF
jgi:hypothetical protein